MVSDARLLIFSLCFYVFFDVFSGTPYGSDFLILTNEIIKKVPKRSAKKYALSLCNPFWHFFCKYVWHFTIFPKPLPKSDSHMHHTHSPSENENFPSAKPPAWTSFLSFFPSHFRSSFRHFCHVLCDFYFSFQVPKPPVFAAFSLLQGILLLILFFLFLRQKNLISGESPETRFLVVLWYF